MTLHLTTGKGGGILINIETGTEMVPCFIFSPGGEGVKEEVPGLIIIQLS